MSKEMTVITLGIWIIVVPYLGVPGSWRTTLIVLTGVGLIVLGFFLRAEALSRGPRRGSSHSFVENSPSSTQEHLPHHEHKEGIGPLN
jgi:hypothetical protein